MAQLSGANGLIQQFDMFSNLLDLDNSVSRRSARINASNYLRVGGRIVGLELRGFSGSFRPTPVTPHVSQMALAALADDQQAFAESYRRALEAARKHLGKTGPNEAESFIAQSWGSRHPLKGPFKTSPTPEDYARILSAVGEQGAGDIRAFVDNYNRFGGLIGARAFVGKEAQTKRFAAVSNTGLSY